MHSPHPVASLPKKKKKAVIREQHRTLQLYILTPDSSTIPPFTFFPLKLQVDLQKLYYDLDKYMGTVPPTVDFVLLKRN